MTINYHCAPHKCLIFSIALILSSFASYSQEIPTDEASIAAGKQLFEANCKTCHRIDSRLIGPPLAGVYDRVPSIDWIIKFVHNSSAVIASGDEYAVKLFNENNKVQMTAFSSFKEKDILNIMGYIKKTAETPKETAAPPPGQQVAGGQPGGAPQYLNLILIGMVIILVLLVIILLFLLAAIKRFLEQRPLTEDEQEVVHSKINIGTITRSPGFIFIIAFIVAALGFKAVIHGLYSIGIQQGYAPKQPIAFSHKIHAGQYEIDCKYCHVGVVKGKNATIPSVNICMNCHNQIKSGTLTGEAEIGKILRAYNENKPIEWVRVHNLPDLAYFNHSQHVVVGNIECQTCHGPIQEMDVVRQYSLLTMGWCLDCHRKTEVNSKGNAYYDKLLELHDPSGKSKMTVEDIGGLECSKCHY
ncbi:MAG TPA: c-type cytochrome [Chryseosolibacter sp.]|nr:c-type cytochrome [Chryseosolibacter sp.]